MTRFVSLDALRGIAALMVVFSHVAVFTYYPFAEHPKIPSALEFVLWNLGATGVDTFFVLSGFVLSLPYLQQGREMQPLKFIFRRFRRLYPAYLVSLLLAVALKHFHGTEPLTEIVMRWYQPLTVQEVLQHLLLLNPKMHIQSVNPVLWTLLVELHMAFFMPVVIRFLASNTMSSFTVLLVTLGGGFLGGFFVFPLGMVPLFVMGALLALHHSEVQDAFQKSPLLRNAAFLLGVALVFHRYWWIQEDLFFIRYISAFGATLVIPAILASPQLQRFLQTPLVSWFGQISYSLYLVHLPILFFVASHAYSSLGGSLGTGLVGMALSVGAAALLHRWFEKPVLNTSRPIRQKKEMVHAE
ncbi:acyltransferase family protein [Deinococcus roseus]|uniref:Acyltransferase n=1 Tax=Deinococcus roseus TaxID=392414 RepID=A0ABQ2D947_9DEIO|nr:acyltransferase [Deinococcus roseus]GGJ47982.1 acyltransferase [Deinococcus roseus]